MYIRMIYTMSWLWGHTFKSSFFSQKFPPKPSGHRHDEELLSHLPLWRHFTKLHWSIAHSSEKVSSSFKILLWFFRIHSLKLDVEIISLLDSLESSYWCPLTTNFLIQPLNPVELRIFFLCSVSDVIFEPFPPRYTGDPGN